VSLFSAHLTGELAKDSGMGVDMELILMRDLLTPLARA